MKLFSKAYARTNTTNIIVYGIAAVFIAMNAIFIAHESFIILFTPMALLVFTLAFMAMDKLLFVLIFVTPLSVPLRELSGQYNFDLFLPTEPIIFALMLLFIFKLFYERKFDKRISYHPVSLAIYFYLIWMFITAITSTMPLVSFKELLSQTWFIIVFYFIMTQVFRKFKNIHRFFWLYIAGLTIVIFYTLNRQIANGLFDHKVAHWAMTPFYNDHTAYGAALAFYIPFLIAMIFYPARNFYQRTSTIIIAGIFSIATVFSYTRATWVSLAVAIFFLIVILLKINLKLVIVTGGIIIALIFTHWTQINLYLQQTRQESSSNLASHLNSITNITTDASNLERLNRWKCALKMFAEKPVFGWGPGTYMFKYAPFQMSYDKTIISTNFGTRGNAHSEYLGPLAESGAFGALSFIIIVIAASSTGLRVYQNTNSRKIKIISLSTLVGLVTYFSHGFLNNFLSTDKASLSFWGFIAVLVALEVYYTNNSEEGAQSASENTEDKPNMGDPQPNKK